MHTKDAWKLVGRFNWVRFSVLSLVVLLAFASPIAQIKANAYTFQIISIRLLDDSGIQSSTFARGQFVMVEATIQNIMAYSYAAESFLMLARMMKEDTMWGLGFFRASLLSGSSITAGPGILIPTNALPGTYKMTVFVWSNWASQGGYPVAASVEVTFTVT